MKTLEDIKQLRAYEMDYVDWEEFIHSIDDPDIVDMEFDEVAKRYALEACRESLKTASKWAYMTNGDDTSNIVDGFRICKESITSEENIPKEVKS